LKREEEKELFNAHRKKRRRKIIIRRLVSALLVTAIIAGITYCAVTIYGLFNPEIYKSGVFAGLGSSRNVEKALNLEVPEWVDVQLIHKHNTARTGIKLNDIKGVVIHYVGNPATTAQNNRDYFDKTSTTVSSHFVVGLEGEVIQCVPLYERSAASNNRNRDTISIEVCHPDATGKFNSDTYNSVVKLTSWLLYNFSLDETDILRHYDITGKTCPKYFVENEDEWIKFKEEVKKELNEY